MAHSDRDFTTDGAHSARERLTNHVEEGRTAAARDAVADLFAAASTDEYTVEVFENYAKVWESEDLYATFDVYAERGEWHVRLEGTATFEDGEVFVEGVDVEADWGVADKLREMVRSRPAPTNPRRF